MKKIFKLLTILVVAFALTGCMKIRYHINITGKDNADVNLTMMYSQEMMDTYGLTEASIKEQLQEGGNFDDWNLKGASENDDGEKYVGFKATAPKDVSKEILKGLTVKDGKYTLKLKGAELNITELTSQLDESGYSMDQLEEMGLEFSFKISLPGTIKSSTIGQVKDGAVNISLTDLEKMADDITIISEKSVSSSSNVGPIIGGIAVVAVIGVGGFYFYKKKNKNILDDSIEK